MAPMAPGPGDVPGHLYGNRGWVWSNGEKTCGTSKSWVFGLANLSICTFVWSSVYKLYAETNVGDVGADQ